MKTNPYDAIETVVYGQGSYSGIKTGLTKREYFAIMAMHGMLANSHDNGMIKPLSQATNEEIAKLAVEQADALINELNKRSENENI